MSISSENDLQGLRRIGAVIAGALRVLRSRVRAGMTTAEIDRVCFDLLDREGARSAPRLFYGFPGSICISVNDEAVHGIPGPREIRPGDLVKLDLAAEKDGYVADAAVTVAVPPVTGEHERLVRCAETAFGRALGFIRAGRPIRDIGAAVESEARRNGFHVIPELTGHGVGRSIHEKPVVPNFPDDRDRTVLTEGLVIAVEPILAARSGKVVEAGDGWTVRTADGGASVHYEHTLVVTRDAPILLTAA